MPHWYRRKRLLVAMTVVAALAALLSSVVFSGALTASDATEVPDAAVAGQAQAQSASVGSPQQVNLQFLAEPPQLDAKKQAELEKALEKTHLPGPPLAASTQAVAGPTGGETKLTEASAAAPGSFTVLRSTVVAPGGNRSAINEPSLANIGRYIFYTGNWYAARSTNGGTSWSYVNPYADMSDFCCDQEVIKDPGRQILLWYRQGVYQSATANNRFRLGVSSNGGATFCFYNFRPNNLNSGWTSQWFDYPHLAVSNDFLYIATNMYTPGGSWIRTVMLRLPLDNLATCSGFSYRYLPWTSNFNFTPIQGATDVMYWASHNSTSSLRIFKWDEASTTVYNYSRTIPAWTSTGRGSATCTVPGGRNPCARLDHRINAGARTIRADGVKTLIWFWTVKQGSGFTYPYVNAAEFTESSLAYRSRPYIYNQSYAFFYASAAPNKRENLGIATYLAGGGYHIRLIAGIDDDFNGVPPGWQVYTIRTSTAGPSSNVWGDYLRVRQHNPEELGWILGGHTMQGTTVEPRYVVFARERDRQSVWWWWTQP